MYNEHFGKFAHIRNLNLKIQSKIKVQFQVRYVGGSNMTGWQLQLASSLARKEGFAKYSVLQQQ